LTEWFVGLRREVQHLGGKAPDVCKREPESREAREAAAEIVQQRRTDLIRRLERIQQCYVRRHADGRRGIVPISEGLHQTLGFGDQHDQRGFDRRH